MKLSILCIAFISLTISTSKAQESLLYKADKKVENAMMKSFVLEDSKHLEDIITQLENLEKSNSTRMIIYWLGYAKYYYAIYLFSTQNSEYVERAQKTLKKTVKMLENELPNKNVEEHALVAKVQGFLMAFNPSPMKAAFLSNKISERLKVAFELDSLNPRLNLVAGEFDYHTPEVYGGKKKCEQYLKNAINLPNQKTPNPYLPSWGKAEAYRWLIEFYIETEQKNIAKKYFKEASNLYPKDFQILELAKKLID